MGATTRRAIFAGAMALAPIAAIAAPAAAPSQIVALYARWEALEAERDVVEARIEAIYVEADQIPQPEALRRRDGDWYYGGVRNPAVVGQFFTLGEIGRFREDQKRVPRIPSNARYFARADEMLAAYDAHEATRRALRNRLGAEALHDRDCQIAEAQDKIEQAIIGMRATTPAELKVKALLVKRYDPRKAGDNLADDVLLSLFRDLGVA